MTDPGRRVGLLTFVSREGRLRSGDDREVLQREAELADALRADGHRVVAGGVFDCEADRAIHDAARGRKHVHPLVEAEPMAVVLSVTGGATAVDVLATVRYLRERAAFAPELVLFADLARAPRAFEPWLAAGAALEAAGFPVTRLGGAIDDPDLRGRLDAAVRFGERRLAAVATAERAHAAPATRRGLLVGPPGHPSGVGAGVPDPTVGLEAVRFDEAAARAAALARPGRDPRVTAAVTALEPHLAPAERDAPACLEQLRSQVAWCLALADLARERDAGFLAVQDGTPSEIWLAAAFLNQDRGFDGRPKDVVPTAPRGDPATALAQALMLPLARQSTAGARLAERDGAWLELVGDVPFAPCFVEDDYRLEVEARRLVGTIDHGHPVTLAALAGRGGRTVLFVIEAETAAGPVEDGARVRLALPAAGAALVDRWPGARGALAPGAHAPALIEMARRRDWDWAACPGGGGLFERRGPGSVLGVPG